MPIAIAVSGLWLDDPAHALSALVILIVAMKLGASRCYYRDLNNGRERRRQENDVRLVRKPH